MISLLHRRSLPSLFFADLKEKRFTGFNVKWTYIDDDVDKDIANAYETLNNKFKESKWNKVFMSLANMIHKSNYSKAHLMNFVRKFKINNAKTIQNPPLYGFKTLDLMYVSFFNEIGKLNKSAFDISEPLYGHEITKETLETAAEIFLFVISPQDQRWVYWYEKYGNWLSHLPSFRRLLGKFERNYETEKKQLFS